MYSRVVKLFTFLLTACFVSGNEVWRVATPWIGTLTFNKAQSGQLVTLTFVSNPANDRIPVARSYDGRDWELSAGPFAAAGLMISCSSSSCTINVSKLTRSGNLFETSYTRILDPASGKGKNAAVARFLEQATFGVSVQDVSSFLSTYGGPDVSSLKSWISNQISATNMTSHRKFFRENANTRWDRVSDRGRSMKNPCGKTGRWRTVALTSRDSMKKISFEAFGSKYLLKIDDEPRTLLDSIAMAMEDTAPAIQLGTQYDMCKPWREFWKEAVGETLPWIYINYECWAMKNGAPRVNVQGLTGLKRVDLTGASLVPIDNVQYDSSLWTSLEAVDDYILQSDHSHSSCAAVQSLFGKEKGAAPTIFGRWNGMDLVYDGRLVLEENTVEKPMIDGGGTAVVETDSEMICSNAPRSFINEDKCVLSTLPTACSSKVPPAWTVKLNQLNLGKMSLLVENVFAFVDIPITNATYFDSGESHTYVDRPCHPWTWNLEIRFERMSSTSFCTQNPLKIQEKTRAMFAKFLKPEFDDPINPYPRYKEITRQEVSQCSSVDRDNEKLLNLGYLTGEDGTCWKHVHPLEGKIYVDSTGYIYQNLRGWAKNGNANILSAANVGTTGQDPNKWMYDNIVWQETYKYFGTLDDVANFDDLPDEYDTYPVYSQVGKTATNTAGKGVVVCGSIGEVANQPFKGDGFQFPMEPFDEKGLNVASDMYRQRHTVWAYTALHAPDQLRQRVAWALSQICVVGFGRLQDWLTESALQYYDIFVRHAFGSYRDILKEVAFSQPMGTFLSSLDNKSYQYSKDHLEVDAFPDENFAREIMQLFSLGLTRMSMNGNPMTTSNGQPIETYDNIDLFSYARAWTGLQATEGRANNEAYQFPVDPLAIKNDWHDVFPKTDLLGGYIGDRNYPLCTDLPKRHALRKGATYRLLGSSNTPELVHEPTEPWWFGSDWGNKPYLERLELSTASPLYKVLCAQVNGQCTYPGKVVLNSNLDYSDANLRLGLEYTSESLRTIRVKSGASSVYYEYVRVPCVELSFFRDGVKVQTRPKHIEGTDPGVYKVEHSLCADPRRDVATGRCSGPLDESWIVDSHHRCVVTLPDSCCPVDWVEGDTSDWDQGYKFCNFFGERMSYDVAVGRCAANGMKACTAQQWSDAKSGYCGFGSWEQNYLMWTTQSCQLKIKIDNIGQVAIVHHVTADFSGASTVWGGVDSSTNNFFRPAWISKFDMTKCAVTPGCAVISGGCSCSILVDEYIAFPSAPASRDDVIRECFIGGVDPSMAPEEYNDLGTCNIAGIIKVYSKRSSSCSRLGPDVVFQYTDDHGIVRFAKNMVSRVEIGDTYSFRTPVQFLSFVDPELRDTLYEIDAVLDSVFYHPNHPPFMAKSMLQRFGHSNPSPDLISTVAWAYRNGEYMGIGSRKYGDLGALIAAILLHPESTSLSVLSDPTFGQLREPLLKIVSFMRSMEYQHDSPLFIQLLEDLQRQIKQGTFDQPSVFNYYLPEYSPPGPIGSSGLVSPESMLLAGWAVASLLNGIIRMTKGGLDPCHGGFSEYWGGACTWDDGDTSLSLGALKFSNRGGSQDEILDQLILTLTSNRLADDKRALIKSSTFVEFHSGDRKKAIRAMMQLVASTPEFQTTSLAQNSLIARPPPPSPGPASSDYKAVIFFFFNGGMDSYNLLAPKGSCHAKYVEARGPNLALSLDSMFDIDATRGTPQACSTFGVNKKFPLGKELHDAEELTFFANMGFLQYPVNKYNWTKTQSQLFAHNSQQYDAQRLDLKKVVGETGVGGRLLDELAKKGFKTSTNSVNTHAHAAAGDPILANPTRQITPWTPDSFNINPSLSDVTSLINDLNGVSQARNNIFSETWSASLQQSMKELEESISMNNNPAYNVDNFKTNPSGLDQNFQTVAKYIKSRAFRNVDRELFVVEDGGYDMHDCNCVGDKLAYIDSTLRAFRTEMQRQGLWNKVVIVTGSDFGRTLNPNSGGGTDHAWGGHYFMLGGDVRGKQILGSYPDLSSNSNLLIENRNRVVPSKPYEAMWNGVAQWMGITDEARLDYMLPQRKSFRKCDLFTDMQLFKSGQTPAYPCT